MSKNFLVQRQNKSIKIEKEQKNANYLNIHASSEIATVDEDELGTKPVKNGFILVF